MAGVFLAHSSTDKRFVRRLAADLLGRGVRVWFDEAEMHVGDSLFAKIEQGIREMDFLAVVLSPASVGSQWVQREVEIALSMEIEGAVVKVLPILYRPCDIPGFLRAKLRLDFSDSRKYSANLERLLVGLTPRLTPASELFVDWTPKTVRLGMLCGLVMTKAGRVTLSDAFVGTLHGVSRSWITGEIDAATQGELVAHAAAKTIADPEGRETTIPLSLEETTYLFSQLARQVLNIVVEIATRARVLTLGNQNVVICQDLVDEVIESIGIHGYEEIAGGERVRPFVLGLFADTVKARLLLHEPSSLEYCEQVAILAFSIFEDSEAYADLVRIAREM